MKKNKKRKKIFFVLEYKKNHGHYCQDSYCSNVLHKKKGYFLSTDDVLKAKRFATKKEARKRVFKKVFKLRKVKIKVKRG